MITNPLFDMIVMFLGITAMYTPWIQLKREDSLTGEELSNKYPQHAWMKSGFVALYLAWVAIVAIVLYKGISSSWMKGVASIGGLLASIGLFIGSFAAITGVSLLPARTPHFLYVVGDDAQRAGRFQVVWSLCVILIASVMEILRR